MSKQLFSSTHEYVKSELISAWNFAILVSKENPLAQRETLEIQDLVGVPLTVAHLEANSPYVLTMKSIFGKYGYSPRIEYLVTRDSLCFEILNRNGVGIASPSFWNRLNERTRSFFEEHIRVYPLKNEFYPVSFVWKGDNTDPNIGRFIEMYQEVCHEGNNQTIIHQAYQ